MYGRERGSVSKGTKTIESKSSPIGKGSRIRSIAPGIVERMTAGAGKIRNLLRSDRV